MIHMIRPAAHAIGCLQMIVEKVTILVVNVPESNATGNGGWSILRRNAMVCANMILILAS
jgi:hypothetical protein